MAKFEWRNGVLFVNGKRTRVVLCKTSDGLYRVSMGRAISDKLNMTRARDLGRAYIESKRKQK